MAIGTFECPICWFDKPHTHDRYMLQWFEDAKSNPAYDVEGQRRYARMRAESEWKDSERHREFSEDPVGVMNRGEFRIDHGVKFGDVRYLSGRDFMFHIGPWIQKKMQEFIAEIASLRAAPPPEELTAAQCEQIVRVLERVASMPAAFRTYWVGESDCDAMIPRVRALAEKACAVTDCLPVPDEVRVCERGTLGCVRQHRKEP